MFAKIKRRNATSDAGAVDIPFAIIGGLMGLMILGIVGIIVFAIVAAINTPSAGRIEAKHFTPAYTTMQCSLVGKVNVCTPVYHGDSWEFDIKNDDEHKEGWVGVSQSTYDARNVGDWYNTKEG